MEDIALPMPTLSNEPLFQLLSLQTVQKRKKRKENYTASSSESIGFKRKKGQRIKSSLTLPWQGLDENGRSPVVWCVKRTQ